MLSLNEKGEAGLVMILATLVLSCFSLMVISKLSLVHNEFYGELLASSRHFNRNAEEKIRFGQLEFRVIPPRADYGAYYYQQDSLAVCQIGEALTIEDTLECNYEF